jgi:hypothetical protein
MDKRSKEVWTCGVLALIPGSANTATGWTEVGETLACTRIRIGRPRGCGNRRAHRATSAQWNTREAAQGIQTDPGTIAKGRAKAPGKNGSTQAVSSTASGRPGRGGIKTPGTGSGSTVGIGSPTGKERKGALGAGATHAEGRANIMTGGGPRSFAGNLLLVTASASKGAGRGKPTRKEGREGLGEAEEGAGQLQPEATSGATRAPE